MRLLIIGNLYDNHNGRFVMNLRKIRQDINISFLYNPDSRMTLPYYCNSLNDIIPITRTFFSFLYKLPFVRALFRMIDQNKSVKTLVKSNRYFDVINVQYVSVYSFLASKYFHVLSKTVLLSPWGSDVYRVNRLFLPLINRIYRRADYVSLIEGRFRDECIRIFGIEVAKIINMDIGSDTIDYIKEHNKEITKEMAKERLGFGSSYVVVCGYNASPAQNHEIIFEALNRAHLPNNYLIVLPMTYSGTNDYKENIKELLKRLELRHIIFDEYLSVENLFYLRRSADMFIHIQNTDANSAAIREFLLTDTKVLNGNWLRYKELEKDVIPYFIVSNIESLANDINVALKTPFTPIPPTLRHQLEEYGWENQIKLWVDFFEKHS